MRIHIASDCLDPHARYVPTPCIVDGTFLAWRRKHHRPTTRREENNLVAQPQPSVPLPDARTTETHSDARRSGRRLTADGEPMCSKCDQPRREGDRSYCRIHRNEAQLAYYYRRQAQRKQVQKEAYHRKVKRRTQA